MTTFATMRSRIADEMANDGDITTSQINNAIRTAIKHFEREPYWFNQKSSVFDTAAGGEFYQSTPPDTFANIVRVESVQRGPATSKEMLGGLDNAHIDEVQDGSVTGEPAYYSRFENRIRLYPIPNDVYRITIRYIQKLPDLMNDDDTNAWVDECEEMIRQAAKRILCTDILHDDGMAARYQALERLSYDRIRAENRTRAPQQRLRADLPFGRQYFDFVRRW